MNKDWIQPTLPDESLLKAIGEFCEIEWGSGGKRVVGQERYIPKIVWRFKRQQPNVKSVEDTICAAVSAFRGRVEWSISFEGRNWVLTPKEFDAFFENGHYRNDVDAIADLAKENPQLGVEANLDIPYLVKEIRKSLRNVAGAAES